jgi:hypothetical protein
LARIVIVGAVIVGLTTARSARARGDDALVGRGLSASATGA